MKSDLIEVYPFKEMAAQIHRYGMRANDVRIIELINETDNELFSFAVTEDNKAMIIVIADYSYYDN